MSDYRVSCDGVAVDDRGALYSLAVYTDGEGFNSYVYKASDVADRTGPNVQTELLDIQLWLTAIWRSETGRLYVTDEEGHARRFDGSAWDVWPVSSRGLTCIWGLSDAEIYAAGDEGVVYRWDGTAWAPFSPPLGDTVFSIHGTSGRNLHVCGADALFWRYDGSWNQIELPTNQRLLGVLALTASDVLVCGGGGVLFRGAVDTWDDISQSGTGFHSLAVYRDAIYLAGGAAGVFRLEDGEAVNVKDTIASYSLVANADYLASAGGVVAARFDGKAWFGSRYS